MSESTFSDFPKSETYTGHDVIDQTGEHLGQVTDVIYEATDETTPAWLVVKPGVMRAAHYVPVEGSYTTDEGNLVIPFDKQWLKSAPKATGDHVIDAETRAELISHYGDTTTA